MIASPYFNIETNVKINLDGEKDKPDVRSKKVEMVKANIETNKKCKQDVKSNIEFDKESKPDKITYEEERLLWYWG